jgi:hypothetical protein
MNQRLFQGTLSAAVLADQLAARFSERHYQTKIHNALFCQACGTRLVSG